MPMAWLSFGIDFMVLFFSCWSLFSGNCGRGEDRPGRGVRPRSTLKRVSRASSTSSNEALPELYASRVSSSPCRAAPTVRESNSLARLWAARRSEESFAIRERSSLAVARPSARALSRRSLAAWILPWLRSKIGQGDAQADNRSRFIRIPQFTDSTTYLDIGETLRFFEIVGGLRTGETQHGGTHRRMARDRGLRI